MDATWYRQATDSVAYWRCELPAKYLPGQVVMSTELVAKKRADNRFDFVNHQGAVIWQFPGSREEAWAQLVMQAQGIPYVVEVDDNYLDASDALWRKRANWAARIRNSETPYSNQGHQAIVRNADAVIVTTDVLAEEYGEFNPNVHICRNSIDPDDWPVLEKPDDGVFRIGWYASLSHDRDSPLVKKALAWASRQPNVEVVNIGLDPGWDFARTLYPWEHHVVLRKWLMRLDVGVAPVQRMPMADARSDLKVLEYLMGGALPLLSDAPPYAAWRDTEYALLAYNDKEFGDRIRWCVKNRDEVRAKALAGRDYVIDHRTFNTEIGRWRAALASVNQMQEAA